MNSNSRENTKYIHAGKRKNEFGAKNEPIYRSSTFVFDSVEQGGRRWQGQEPGFSYARPNSPTVTTLEKKLAILEHAEDCVCASSGMGAISAVMWSFLEKGKHLLSDKSLYGYTNTLFTTILPKFGIEVTLVDFNDLELVKRSLKSNTVIVYFESPTNPMLKVSDIQEISNIAHTYNKNIKVVIDNTFCSPVVQLPLTLGADIVIHSLTKYLNGHSDVLAGCVCGTHADIHKVRYNGIAITTGSVLSPDDAYLILRGLKTLGLRVKQQSQNALKIAEYLQKAPFIKKVYCPQLANDPGYEIAKKQMRMACGVLSFETNLSFEKTKALINHLQLITIAVSLGGIETLIEHPASMTHSALKPEELESVHITPNLVRLAVGLEDVEDIIEDFEQAYKAIK